jgi:hypothetical protein
MSQGLKDENPTRHVAFVNVRSLLPKVTVPDGTQGVGEGGLTLALGI